MSPAPRAEQHAAALDRVLALTPDARLHALCGLIYEADPAAVDRSLTGAEKFMAAQAEAAE